MSKVVVVTGTDTGVGKTVVTAALARRYADTGTSVSVVKPVQTGVLPAEPGDVDEVRRLSGVTDVHEFARLADPLAPSTAARRAGVTLPGVAEHAARIQGLAADVVLVEGAGGILVELDSGGGTLAELAAALPTATAVVVARAGLGTLNHTVLTVEALRARAVPVAGLVIGAWPAEPGLAESCNREDLPRVTAAPLLGTLPDGAGRHDPERFAAEAPRWLPQLP